MGQLSRKIAIFVLMAGGLVATAIAGPKPDSAPRLEAKPIPSGMLDIDFRFGDWTDDTQGIVTDYIAEMRENVKGPRLNDEISLCFFDLGRGKYIKDGGVKPVASNAVGNILVQLDHLEWMIRTAPEPLLHEDPWRE